MKKLRYEPSTQTIRSVPENYWLASVKDGEVVFDSWDGVAKEWLISNNFKSQIREFWKQTAPDKPQELNKMNYYQKYYYYLTFVSFLILWWYGVRIEAPFNYLILINLTVAVVDFFIFAIRMKS